MAYRRELGILMLLGFGLWILPELGKKKIIWNRQVCMASAGLPVFLLVGFCLFLSAKRPPDAAPLFQAVRSHSLEVEVTGCISGIEERVDPKTNVYSMRVMIEDSEILYGENSYHKHLGKILIFLEEPMNLKEGNRILVSGTLKEIPPAANPGEFDRKSYYEGLGVSYLFYGNEVSVIDDRQGFLGQIRFRYREIHRTLAHSLEQICGRDSAYFRAMVLGEKWALSEEVQEAYQKNGIGHLLSISGLHLSLLCMGLYRFLRRKCLFSYGTCLIVCGFLSVSYMLITGSSIGTERAALMFVIFLYSQALGRQYDIVSAAAGAALFLLIRNPWLFLSGGFWLSFSAVLSLGLLLPELSMKVPDKDKRRLAPRLRELLTPPLVIFLGTLPVIVSSYYEYPVFSAIINLAAIPLFPVIALSGLVGSVLGMLFPGIGTYLMLPARGILRLYELLCSFFEGLPFSVWRIGEPGFIRLLLYLFLLALGIWRIRGKKRALILALAVLVLTVKLPLARVTFLSVGQGDSCILETGREVLLIDGGSSDKANLAENILLPFLKSRAIGNIDYAFVSHGDSDHMNGLHALLREGKIRNLVLPKGQENKQDKLRNLAEEAKAAGVSVLLIGQGESLSIHGGVVRCLWPKETFDGAENESSMVLWVTINGKELLFPGDLEGEGETELVKLLSSLQKQNQLPDSFDLLKVSHHGSAYATYEPILELLRPRTAVISCGEYNSYGHPAPETLERLKKQGCDIFRTPEDGAVSFKLWK